eukprot:752602-Hanusia_phi.AAC.3
MKCRFQVNFLANDSSHFEVSTFDGWTSIVREVEANGGSSILVATLIVGFTLISLVVRRVEKTIKVLNFGSRYLDLKVVARDPLYQISERMILTYYDVEEVCDKTFVVQCASFSSKYLMHHLLADNFMFNLAAAPCLRSLDLLSIFPPPPSVISASFASSLVSHRRFRGSKEKAGDVNVFKLYFLKALGALAELRSVVMEDDEEEGGGREDTEWREEGEETEAPRRSTEALLSAKEFGLAEEVMDELQRSQGHLVAALSSSSRWLNPVKVGKSRRVGRRR